MSHNLPKQSTPFIGRKSEVSEIAGILQNKECRLLSLIGAGGMGKTRLALEVAQSTQQGFDVGVYFVALQPLTSADGIVSAIVSVLNIEFFSGDKTLEDYLLDYLSDKNLLLLMDNFEHVLEGATLVTKILKEAPQVKILVTSRETLNLRLEWQRNVNGMIVPDKAQDDSIATYDSIQLFAERARRIRDNFNLEEEQSCVARICQLVGGMPLGIELAVAWLKSLSCDAIATEIQRSADILATRMRDMPERHQSIRAVFDSSWEMLSSNERDAFTRLSVFRGSVTHQAMQSISGANLLTISALVDKAMLNTLDNGRYQIHELLRQYAYEKLEESNQLDAVLDLHSNYYLDFIGSLVLDLTGSQQKMAFEQFETETDNIWIAWQRAIQQSHYAKINQAYKSIHYFFDIRHFLEEGIRWLQYARDNLAPSSNFEHQFLLSCIESRLIHLLWLKLEIPQNIELRLARCLKVAEIQQDQLELGFCKQIYALMPDNSRVMGKTRESFAQESLVHFQEADFPYHTVSVYSLLGVLQCVRGEFETGFTTLRNGIQLSQKHGIVDGEIWNLLHLGKYMALFDTILAETYMQDAINLASASGATLALVNGLIGLTWIKFLVGDIQALQTIIEEAWLIVNDRLVFILKSHLLFCESLINSIAFGDYAKGLQLAEECYMSTHQIQYDKGMQLAFAIAQIGLKDFESADKNLKDSLSSLLMDRRSLVLAICSNIILIANQGLKARSVELLSFILTFPEAQITWTKTWSLLTEVHNSLQNELSADEYQTAWTRGQSLNIDKVVQELLSEPTSDSDDIVIPAHILEANTLLFEPLSERELEVLSKIGQGHTNREIAEQLFVGVSTVKKHITHIYGKLEVENRTQALLKAQELKLI